MSKKLLWVSLPIWVWLNGCAQPVDNGPSNIISSRPARARFSPIQLRTPLPAVAAEYETTVVLVNPPPGESEQKTYRWRFWRSEQRIETQNLQDNNGEVWLKFPDGKIGCEQLFHEQRQVIEYNPGDLAAIDYKTDWPSLGSLLNPAMIASLYPDKTTDILGKPALHYQSKDALLEVSWLEQEQLPGLIKMQEHGETLVTRLTALYPLAQSPWPYQRSANYRYTDFADLGDKESDPFIKSIQHKIKGTHSH